MNRNELQKIDVIESKIVSRFCLSEAQEKIGLKSLNLLKTQVDGMTAIRLSRIFMKTNEMKALLQNVDEKT